MYEAFYSVRAWRRNSQWNQTQVARVLKPGGQILQVGGVYSPVLDTARSVYNIFTTYTMDLAAKDKASPFMPRANEFAEYCQMERAMLSGAAHIFVQAQFVKRNLVDVYGVANDKVVVTGMGIDDFYVEHSPSKVPDALTYKLLFVGRDFWLKGGDLVVQAFERMRGVLPQLQLVVIGPDPSEVPDVPGVQRMGPINDRTKLLQHYRDADMFVMPSRYDSFGFVFLEAMSQGLPCMGARFNAMPEIIRDGVDGFIVSPGSVDEMSTRILAFYSDPRLRSQLGQNAMNRVLDRFRWQRVASEVKDILFASQA